MKIDHNLFLVLYLIPLILSIISGFLYRYIFMQETHFIWDKIPNFYALFGFFGSIILITVYMVLKRILSRNKDYYAEIDEEIDFKGE